MSSKSIELIKLSVNYCALKALNWHSSVTLFHYEENPVESNILKLDHIYIIQQLVGFWQLLANPMILKEGELPRYLWFIEDIGLLLFPFSIFVMFRAKQPRALWLSWSVLGGLLVLCAIRLFVGGLNEAVSVSMLQGFLVASSGAMAAFLFAHFVTLAGAVMFFLFQKNIGSGNFRSLSMEFNLANSLLRFEIVVVGITILLLGFYINIPRSVEDAKRHSSETYLFNAGETLESAVTKGDSVLLISENPFSFIVKDGNWSSDTLFASQFEGLSWVYLQPMAHDGNIFVFGTAGRQDVGCAIKRKGAKEFVTLNQLSIGVPIKFLRFSNRDTLTLESNYPFEYTVGERSGRVQAGSPITLYAFPEEDSEDYNFRISPTGPVNQRIIIRGNFHADEPFLLGYFITIFWFGLIACVFIYGNINLAWPTFSVFLHSSTYRNQPANKSIRASEITQALSHSMVVNLTQSKDGANKMEDLERRAGALMAQLQAATQPQGIWEHYRSVRQTRKYQENLEEMSKLFKAMSSAMTSATGVISAQSAFEAEQIKHANLKEVASLQAEVDRLRLEADITEEKLRAVRTHKALQKENEPSPAPQEPKKTNVQSRHEQMVEEFRLNTLRRDLKIKELAKSVKDLSELRKVMEAEGVPAEDIEFITVNLRNQLIDET